MCGGAREGAERHCQLHGHPEDEKPGAVVDAGDGTQGGPAEGETVAAGRVHTERGLAEAAVRGNGEADGEREDSDSGREQVFIVEGFP